jgi:DNA-binding PadR family transcriptional regulator
MCPFSDKREILKEINKNGVYAFNTNLLGSKRGFIYNVLNDLCNEGYLESTTDSGFFKTLINYKITKKGREYLKKNS